MTSSRKPRRTKKPGENLTTRRGSKTRKKNSPTSPVWRGNFLISLITSCVHCSPDTLEWRGPAPLYDSGSSLGYDKLMPQIRSGRNVTCKCKILTVATRTEQSEKSGFIFVQWTLSERKNTEEPHKTWIFSFSFWAGVHFRSVKPAASRRSQVAIITFVMVAIFLACVFARHLFCPAQRKPGRKSRSRARPFLLPYSSRLQRAFLLSPPPQRQAAAPVLRGGTFYQAKGQQTKATAQPRGGFYLEDTPGLSGWTKPPSRLRQGRGSR